MCTRNSLENHTAIVLKQYAISRNDRGDTFASSGGVAIVVVKGIACKLLHLRTPLEAVAVQVVILDRLVTMTSIYIPHTYQRP